ncbi:hypothetical protein GRZ40_004023 [Salmonella bongori]|nr:hypothetical protein [Salmonella bongori]EDP8726840.1 hypothetical protein [Salmonella bongori]
MRVNLSSSQLSVNAGMITCRETDMNERIVDGGEEPRIAGAFKPGQSRTFSIQIA